MVALPLLLLPPLVPQVNKLWSSNYDRAMICYLQCLNEFGEYAKATDKRLPGDQTFLGFPFPIDGDKVRRRRRLGPGRAVCDMRMQLCAPPAQALSPATVRARCCAAFR